MALQARALLGIWHALQTIQEVPSLMALKKGAGAAAFERLVEAVKYGGQLCAGARRRLPSPRTLLRITQGRAIARPCCFYGAGADFVALQHCRPRPAHPGSRQCARQ